MSPAVLEVRACSLAEEVFWVSKASWVRLCWGRGSRSPVGVLPSAPLCWLRVPHPDNALVALVGFCFRGLGCVMVVVEPVATGGSGLMEDPEA